jgi:pimeloyl-ACP methyl ester carboxylesterase
MLRAAVAMLVAAVLALAGCSGGSGTGASSGAGPFGAVTSGASGSGKPAAPGSTIAWKGCGGGFQCGTLRVPLDWTKPSGSAIELAVIRKPAKDQAQRVGSVVLNPGGPGEGGVSFLRDFIDGRLPAHLNDRLDLVSWDPRGTGSSDPIACTTTAESLEPDPDPVPETPEEKKELVDRETHDTDECLEKEGPELPYVGTQDTVRDLDALRAALGDAKLTYVGFSYGTVIGTVYMEKFPTHVRAMVLDGVASTGADPVADTFRQAQSFEHNLDAFLDDCKARGSKCTFGDGNPRGALLALITKLEAGERIPADYSTTDSKGHDHPRRGTLGIGELYSALALPLYNRSDWPALEKGLAAATDGSSDNPGYLLLSFRDQLAGRQQDGTWSHLQDANVAISCADQAQRASTPLGDTALAAEWAAKLPIFGAAFAVGLPGCWKWPAALHPLRAPTSITGVPPVVLIGSTMDPATPYSQAVALQKVVSGSVLLTWESADHTAYGRGSACLDPPVTAYLTSLTVPKNGLECKGSDD